MQRESIPNRLIGGHKFFERLEVKDILAYLQLVENPSFEPAILRVLNVPKRGIGEKVSRAVQSVGVHSWASQSVQSLLAEAKAKKMSLMEFAEHIVDTSHKNKHRQKLEPFVRAIRRLRARSHGVSRRVPF